MRNRTIVGLDVRVDEDNVAETVEQFKSTSVNSNNAAGTLTHCNSGALASRTQLGEENEATVSQRSHHVMQHV